MCVCIYIMFSRGVVICEKVNQAGEQVRMQDEGGALLPAQRRLSVIAVSLTQAS